MVYFQKKYIKFLVTVGGSDWSVTFVTFCLKASFIIMLIMYLLWQYTYYPQGLSLTLLVKKMAQRCGIRQNDPMTSPGQDQLSVKSNNSGF